jgi:hypothetical protein
VERAGSRAARGEEEAVERTRQRAEVPAGRREDGDGRGEEVAKGANNRGWTNKPMDEIFLAIRIV